MTTDVNEAPSKQGIFVNIVGTAIVKVNNEDNSILKAVEQFCNGGAKNTVAVISSMVEQILEGKLRGIISTLTVEQINEDRAAFEQRIEDDIREELHSMGLLLISYSILRISTQGGYLENRAIPQIASAKADAEAIKAKGIAEAESKDRLAEAMAKYGDAAIVELVVGKLPEIMAEVAKPMEQVDKITIIDNGGREGASKLTKLVTDVTTNGFQTVKDITGIDLTDIITTFTNKENNILPKENKNTDEPLESMEEALADN